jgi:hypothetical protein
MSFKHDAEFTALIDELFPKRKPPRPKLVVSEDRVVRDIDMPVRPRDPNYRNAQDRVVSVRVPDPDWLH